MDAVSIIADLNGRVRSLENKYNTLTERLLVVNQNMIEEYKKIMRGMRDLEQEIKKSKIGRMNTEEILRDIVKEMEIFAKKDQIKVLEKYVDQINIMNFVTDDQLDNQLEKLKLELKETKSKRGR
tara:strand:- start:4317 stop:4691 length:375 start_codon:yes stop_codon:yes gene_type:complete